MYSVVGFGYPSRQPKCVFGILEGFNQCLMGPDTDANDYLPAEFARSTAALSGQEIMSHHSSAYPCGRSHTGTTRCGRRSARRRSRAGRHEWAWSACCPLDFIQAFRQSAMLGIMSGIIRSSSSASDKLHRL